MKKPFNVLQAMMLKALTKTLFDRCEMVISADQVVANIQEQFAHIVGPKPKEIGLALYALFIFLWGPVFLLAPYGIRRALIERRLQHSRIDFFQDLARTRAVILAGYYGHWIGHDEASNFANPVLQQMRYQLPGQRDRSAPGEVKVERNFARDLPASVFVGHDSVPECADIIVIGSGAGGAVAAAALADEGHEVLIVEAGDHYPSARITLQESRMTARLFKDGALQSTKDRDIVIFQGRVVGGSPVINNGICLRVHQDGLTHPMAPDVYAAWVSVGATIAREELEQSYAAVEAMLEVSEMNKLAGRNNGPHLLKGWEAYRDGSNDAMDQLAVAGWFRKNWGPQAPGTECVYCGYCNTGCPYGRKKAMPESYLAYATSAERPVPAKILANAEATLIRWSDGANDKKIAERVEIRLSDGRKRVVHAHKGVVVAAGALASSNLLDASGIEGTGKGMSLNIACPVVALMPHGCDKNVWNEDQMATYVDRGDFLLESHFQPPMSMATLVPGWFDEHFERMQNYNRLVSAGVLFPADRLGRMVDGKLELAIGPPELDVLRRGLATMTKIHFRAGAVEVFPALLRGQTLLRGLTDAEIDAFYRDAIREPDDVVLSSSHPHGGNGISRNPHNGVVDLNQRVHGTTNCYVADASVLPTCIRVNAQLTTMAMAHRAFWGKQRFA